MTELKLLYIVREKVNLNLEACGHMP